MKREKKKSRGKLTEFELIKEIKTWLNQKNLIVPIGDDAAAFSLNAKRHTLLTTDSLVENVHFKLKSIKATALGYKALAVNVSDIAAMGGEPKFATLALGLPTNIDLRFVKDFFKGLNEAASNYSLTIAGGDLTSAKELLINISVIGQVDKGRILKRRSAKIGEQILVTGSLGGSAAGLKLALGDTRGKAKGVPFKQVHYFLNKHFRPEPRLAQAKLAAAMDIKTAIDVSDGLVSDCQRICEASKVGCRLLVDSIPIDKKLLLIAKKIGIDPLQAALSGGEDYELIFTASKNKATKLMQDFKKRNWSITVIGKITSEGIEVVDNNGKQLKWQKGYEHFE